MNLFFRKTFLLTILSLVFFAPVFTYAADYVVTPRVIDVDAEARDIITKTITIKNNENHIINVFPSVNEIVLDEGGDITEFKGPTMVDRTTAITSWIEIQRSQVSIPAGGTKELTMTIRMNPNTESGEYHALLGFGAGKNRPIAEAKVKDNQAPSIVVTIRVADKKVEFVDLGGFHIEKYVTSNNNEAISYTLDNPGDVTVVPRGEIIFYDSGGKEKLSIDANPDKVTLAPGQEVEITRNLPINGMMGRQKAFLSISYGATQIASVYDTVFFYVLPWKILLSIFLGIAVFAITLTLYLHRKFELGGVEEDDYDDDAQSIGLRIREGVSDDVEHDINLRTKNDS